MRLVGLPFGITVAKRQLPYGFAQDMDYFDPEGKPPSTHTIEPMRDLRQSLPFADERNFDEARRGLISRPKVFRIGAEAGAPPLS